MAVATAEQGLRKSILAKLAELGGQAFAEEDIIFEGQKLIIPVGMNVKDAILFLKRKLAEDEEITEFSRRYNYRPWDGAYSAYQALKKAFGAVSHGGTTGFFASPPKLITIEVGPGETAEIPWGLFGIPMLPDVTFAFGGVEDEEYGSIFTVTASGPKKHRFHIEGIFRLIEDQLATGSIYRGKAMDGKEMPGFLDLSAVKRDKVVYSAEVERQLEANIDALLKHSQTMRDNGLPLKRAVLMHGKYGTGKTLRAFLTAQTAVANDWTFLYARPGRDDLHKVMQTARLYQPAVVFFEDIDSLADPDNAGGDGITKLLDTFDGITAKGTEIIAILTSNHADKIHKGMLRPGRLDAVIEISHLDHPGVERLVSVSVPEGMLDPELDWERVAEAMDDFTPAYIVEAADRAFRFAISDNDGSTEGLVLTTTNLCDAAQSLRSQLELMEGAKELPDRDSLTVNFENLVEATASRVVTERVHPDLIVQKA